MGKLSAGRKGSLNEGLHLLTSKEFLQRLLQVRVPPVPSTNSTFGPSSYYYQDL